MQNRENSSRALFRPNLPPSSAAARGQLRSWWLGLLTLIALLLPALPAHAATYRFSLIVRGSLDSTCGNADDVKTLTVAPDQPFYLCYGILNPFPPNASNATVVSNIQMLDNGVPVAGAPATLAPQQVYYAKVGPIATSTNQTHSLTATGVGANGDTYLGGPDVGFIQVLNPKLTVQKTVSTDGTCPGIELVTVAPGTPVTYCYAVTNSGDTAVNNVKVTDDGNVISIGNLASGQTGSGSGGHVAVADVNTPAVASGTAAVTNTPVVSPPDGAAVKVVSPSLQIATTVSTDGTCPGQEIVNVLTGTPVTWCYVVTNDGAIAVDDVLVKDNFYGDLDAPAFALEPGESVTLSRPAPAGGITVDTDILASAHGIAPITNVPVTSNRDPAAVNVVGPRVDIDVTVSTNGTCPGVDVATVPAGTSVVYCYDVSNIGDDELVNIDVVNQDDVLVGNVVGLQPGQSQMLVGASTTVLTDATEHGTANGTDIYGFHVTATDLAKVHPLFAKISIQKTVSANGTCPGVELETVITGTTVTYCYQVTNAGDTALNAITVVDDNGTVVPVPDLAPGASATVSAPYVATADVATMAAAHATNTPLGTPIVSTPDDAAVKVVIPVLWISKTVSTDGSCPGSELVTVLAGTSVTYCYTVTNAGNTPVAGIIVNDNGTTIPAGNLSPGQSTTVSSTHTAQNDESTSATASGTETTLGTPVVAPPDGAVVDVVHPALSIAKTVSTDGNCPGVELVTVLSGTSVTYCYTVSNTGDTTVNNVVITDTGVSIPVGNIPAGGSADGHATFVATSDANTPAVANGTDEATGTPVASPPDPAAVDVVSPSLAISKTASSNGNCPGSELVTVLSGSAVGWCYAVTNTGDTQVNGVVVTDDDGSVVSIGDLAPGATGNGSVGFAATVDVNTFAGASGTVPALGGSSVSSPIDNAGVDVIHPALVIQKTVSTSGVCPGVELVTVLVNTPVTYCYTVTNTGDTPVANVMVSDDGHNIPVGNLGPGQSGTGSSTNPALADSNTPATAAGTVTATNTPVISPPDPAAVDVVSPALSIAVTVSKNGTCPGVEVVNVLAGTAVTWCYVVTNTGDTPVVGIHVTDNQYGVVPGAAFDLTPGASHTLSLNVSANVDVTLTASAAGTAPATGTPVVSPQDPAVVNVVSPNVDIDVTVAVNGTCPGADSVTVSAGTNVVYCYKVTNNGDETLTDVTVTDGGTNVIANLPDLDPGESTTVSSLPQLVNGDVTVPGTVNANDVYGYPVTDSDTALVHALFAKLQIQKTVSLNGQCPGVELVTVLSGTPATYCYLVTNSGDTAVTNIKVNDDGRVINVGNLTPGGSQVVSTNLVATVDEATFAKAVGTNPASGAAVVSNLDDAAINVVHPTLSIQKTASLDGTCPGLETVTVLQGTTVTYCYAVTNTGDTTIGDIAVDDAAAHVQVGTLTPGQTATVTSTITAGANDIRTPAVASGTDTATWTNVKSPPDDALIDVIHPKLSIATTVSTNGSCPGLEVVNVLTGTAVKWCYVVTNTGDVPVKNIAVTDTIYGAVSGGGGTINPGQSITLSRPVTATVDVTLNASVTGKDTILNSNVAAGPDPAVVNVVCPKIDIDVTVTTNGTCPGVDSTTVAAGTSVKFCYKVKNIGEETLTNVVIKNASGTTIATIGTMAPNATSTFVGPSTTITTEVTATGVASGVDQFGFSVTDTDTAVVQPLLTNIQVEKTAPASFVVQPATGCGEDGDYLTYTIKVKNSGQSAAANVVLTDVLPSGVSYLSYTKTKGTCSYTSSNRKVTCNIGTVNAGETVTITIKVDVDATCGTITNTASATTTTPETDTTDNSDSATTRISNGATRTIGFYGTHPTMTLACLNAIGGSMDLGFIVLRDEKYDNEIDGLNGPDNDSRKETGIAMVMGILNANVTKYTNNAQRPALEKAKMQAARQLVAAICNVNYLGTPATFDINGMVQALKGTNTTLINSYANQADSFNNSGDARSLSVSSGAANSKYPWDDPTDKND